MTSETLTAETLTRAQADPPSEIACAVQTTGLQKSYGGRIVVDDVDLHLPTGVVRARWLVNAAGLWAKLSAAPGVVLGPPLGYLEFLSMSSQAKLIVTDSGGLQEESTVLGIPCLTLRENTERPEAGFEQVER